MYPRLASEEPGVWSIPTLKWLVVAVALFAIEFGAVASAFFAGMTEPFSSQAAVWKEACGIAPRVIVFGLPFGAAMCAVALLLSADAGRNLKMVARNLALFMLTTLLPAFWLAFRIGLWVYQNQD